MKVLIIRHAIAEPRSADSQSGPDDHLRPLSDKGKGRMALQSRGLRELAPALDAILSSPFVRALDTAKILREVYPEAAIEICDELRPDARYASIFRRLSSFPDSSIIALVGHEPHLSGLLGIFTHASKSSYVKLKKGSACLIEFARAPRPGEGRLCWLLPPAALRRIGGKAARR